MLLTTSILYMGYQWILMSTFAYYMRFLLNFLSFCAITTFLVMISIWLLRKCSNRIHIVLGFYLVCLGFGHLLYIAVWASFFSLFPPPSLMQRRRVEAESVTHNYYNSSTKPKFYKNTRLAGKIIEKTSLTNFY